MLYMMICVYGYRDGGIFRGRLALIAQCRGFARVNVMQGTNFSLLTIEEIAR